VRLLVHCICSASLIRRVCRSGIFPAYHYYDRLQNHFASHDPAIDSHELRQQVFASSSCLHSCALASEPRLCVASTAAVLQAVMEAIPTGSVFWYFDRFWPMHESDTLLTAVCSIGVTLSLYPLVTGRSSVLLWAVLWTLYQGIHSIGQLFWGFGWDIQICETVFLVYCAAALSHRSATRSHSLSLDVLWWVCTGGLALASVFSVTQSGKPHHTSLRHHFSAQVPPLPPPFPPSPSPHFFFFLFFFFCLFVNFVVACFTSATLRFLIARIMLGAGLIKVRGDQCWRDLTCMHFHYQTQPIPNPLSWYLHHLPPYVHQFEVLVNHFVEVPLSPATNRHRSSLTV
jgi:hypothetical protein